MQNELESIMRRFGADSGTIHLVEDGVLVLKASIGIPPHIRAIVAQVAIGKGMAGAAVAQNEPIASCNIQVDQTGNVRPAAKQTGVNGAIVVPMRDPDGVAQGALGIGVQRAYEYTSEETAELLELGTRLLSPSMQASEI